MGSSLQFAVRRLQAGRQQRLRLTGRTATQATTGTQATEGRLGRAVVALQERVMLREERPGTEDAMQIADCRLQTAKCGERKATLKYFVPFKSFYGGWLVYELAGRLWRQYAVPSEMGAAGVGFTRPI